MVGRGGFGAKGLRIGAAHWCDSDGYRVGGAIIGLTGTLNA